MELYALGRDKYYSTTFLHSLLASRKLSVELDLEVLWGITRLVLGMQFRV